MRISVPKNDSQHANDEDIKALVGRMGHNLQKLREGEVFDDEEEEDEDDVLFFSFHKIHAMMNVVCTSRQYKTL